ncbi:hypothetical protein ACN6Q1_03720, partial [Acinetobacter baumannii]
MSLLQLWEDVKQNEWIDIPAGWLQGRTVFGGLVAGVLMQKACSYIQDSNKSCFLYTSPSPRDCQHDLVF